MVYSDWSKIEKVFLKHPNIFPARFVSFKIFKEVYAKIWSRTLSWGINSPSLVPVADLFNHR